MKVNSVFAYPFVLALTGFLFVASPARVSADALDDLIFESLSAGSSEIQQSDATTSVTICCLIEKKVSTSYVPPTTGFYWIHTWQETKATITKDTLAEALAECNDGCKTPPTAIGEECYVGKLTKC